MAASSKHLQPCSSCTQPFPCHRCHVQSRRGGRNSSWIFSQSFSDLKKIFWNVWLLKASNENWCVHSLNLYLRTIAWVLFGPQIKKKDKKGCWQSAIRKSWWIHIASEWFSCKGDFYRRQYACGLSVVTNLFQMLLYIIYNLIPDKGFAFNCLTIAVVGFQVCTVGEVGSK